MDTLVLTISLAGLVFFGIAFFLLVCWQIIKSVFEWAKLIKRHIKHEPEPQEWYFLAYTCKKEGITTTCSAHIGINRKKLKTSDFESIEAELKEMNEADYIVITSITHLGKE